MRGRIKALRRANRSKVGDPELINSALETELEAVEVQRAADREELSSIISELEPMVGGAADA